ncbi:glycosyltransferase family 87 protein [Actinokineospora iranica]|uniref:DUF2029 domain-containing protein n=1 Tax=Actinokineospora iranica TaxID=1271860 RepID=A0A1G6J781_9PSEU|nr:glycosyltransferase family 87 protein [Actinokineospora iranica]SDC14423.1 Protein of unknown function [Actinokineospora iranica]
MRRGWALRLDLALYAVAAVAALVTAFASEFYGYRMWGNFAAPAYLAAFALTARISLTGRGSRWTPVWVAWAAGTVVPMLVLVFRRAPSFVWGPWPWSFPAQPEVWVIERSARALFADGTPYLDLDTLNRAPHADDYTPYGPSMTLFGFPRAWFGDHPLTDSRVMFLLVSVAAIGTAWHLLGRPAVPVRAAHLAVVSPLTALTLTVAGDDVAVIALIVLAGVLAYRTGPAWSGALCAVLVTMKLTALPAAAVLAVGVLATRGSRAFAAFACALGAVGVAIVLPVLAADPAAFVEHVVKFPVGLGRASSPASSPLPGHLVASIGPAGHTAALVLLGLAACAVAAWVTLRPPETPADAMLRVATGLGAAIALAPATRWGYLVYPVALLGAMIAFTPAAREQTGEPVSAFDSGVDSAAEASRPT